MNTQYEFDEEYDDADLVSISQGNEVQLPPARKRESLNDFLGNLTMKETIPKQDIRRMWVKKSEERDRACKQLRDAKSKIAYWMSKARVSEEVVNKCEQDLQKLEALVLADIYAR